MEHGLVGVSFDDSRGNYFAPRIVERPVDLNVHSI